MRFTSVHWSTISCLFLLSFSSTFGQSRSPINNLKGSQSVYLEIIGSAWYSVNYDRVFYHKEKKAFGWRVGVNLLPHLTRSYNAYMVLGEGYFLRGKPPHFFEAGIGIDYWDGIKVPKYVNEIHWNAVVRLPGYRYQKPKGGFFFRAGFTPWIYLRPDLNYPFFLRGGVSIGYTFKPKKRRNQ